MQSSILWPVPNPGYWEVAAGRASEIRKERGKKERMRGREGVLVRGRVRGTIMEKVILKMCYFLTNICLYLRNDTTYTHCYIGAVIGTNIFYQTNRRYVLNCCWCEVFGLEPDQSVEYGTRQCQDLSRVVHRLINDGETQSLFQVHVLVW